MRHSTLPASTHLLDAAFHDASSGLTFEVHHPRARPDVWREYLDGAEAAYARRGVGHALHRDEIEDADGVSMFFVGRRPDGSVAAGIRCHGPLARIEDSESLAEMAGSPEIEQLTEHIRRFLPFGVVEQKGAWSDVKGVGPRAMFTTFNRCNLYAIEWLRCEFAICTVREELRGTILANGGRQLGTVSVPFPSERHRTVLMAYRRCRTSAAAKTTQATAERVELTQMSRTRRPGVEPIRPALEEESWRPIILDCSSRTDRAVAQRLAVGAVQTLDQLDELRNELRGLRPAVGAELLSEAPHYVFYPWRRTLVKLVGPRAFERLRFDRNRHKITIAEQERLRSLTIGVIGLSVGHAIAHLLAMEGLCGELRLADFDELALSNLNRIPATVLDVGINKSVAAARRIAEIDPYLPVSVWRDGVSAENLDAFLEGLDVVIEECDSLDMKLLVREAARARGIPVVMETSDRGLIDVERYDLEPDRPLLHGLLGDLRAEAIAGLSMRDKVPYVLQILDPEQISTRGAASLAEVGKTLTTWPQLAGDVALGAATTAAAVRRLGRDEELGSGRARIDLDGLLGKLETPVAPYQPVTAPESEDDEPPSDPLLAIAYAASRAPSGGNVQPWQFELNDRSLRIFLDAAKSVTIDVGYRGSYVAIGAALFNAKVAAAAQGRLGPVELFPDPRFDGPVAELTFAEGRDDTLASFLPGVLHRSTNRRKGSPHPIDEATFEALAENAALEESGLRVLADRTQLDQAAELMAEADRLRFLTPQTHREMMSEFRWAGIDSLDTGIDVRALEFDPADLAALRVAKRDDVMAQLADWEAGSALGDNARQWIGSSSAVVAVTTRGSSPTDFVRSGGAVMRTWLAAEAAGLAVHPVSPLFIYAHDEANFLSLVGSRYAARLQELAVRFRRVLDLAEGEHLGLVLRLSHAGPPSVRSRRLPLEEVLVHRSPAPRPSGPVSSRPFGTGQPTNGRPGNGNGHYLVLSGPPAPPAGGAPR